MKKALSMFLSFALVLCLMSFGVFSVSAAQSGTWGNLTWTLENNGTLTISGEGEMDNFVENYTSAWRSYTEGIKSVVIEDGVTSIGDDAFSWCDSLKSVSIPNSVTTIGDYAFSWCGSLESITIPHNVTSIGDGAFYTCSSLESIVVDKNNANYCDIDGVLFNKSKTTLLQYPISKADTHYTLPDGVTSIARMACFTQFVNEDGVSICPLISITIPDSVTTIGDDAFSSIKTVYYGGSKADWEAIEIGDGNELLLNANIIYNHTASEPGTEKGDVNYNGYVDNIDATVVLKYDAGLIDFDEATYALADVNGDGEADNIDATLILKYDAGIIDSF